MFYHTRASNFDSNSTNVDRNAQTSTQVAVQDVSIDVKDESNTRTVHEALQERDPEWNDCLKVTWVENCDQS